MIGTGAMSDLYMHCEYASYNFADVGVMILP